MRDMLGRGQALSVNDALGLILQSLPANKGSEEKVSLEEAFGRIISRDVVSGEDLPGFSRSTVDGYAVNSGDSFGASETSPAYLKVTDEIFMGDKPDLELHKGEAAKIATGGMLPDNADAVVMFEHIQSVDEGTIEVQRAVAPFENVIQMGEDVRAGELIVDAGRRLRPHDVAVLAGVGCTEVYVYEKPSVAIISTGDEIIPIGVPVKPGQVRDMNSLCLAGLILDDGGKPQMKGIVRDDYVALRGAVESSLGDSDIVLITGGSSVGIKDMTEKVIADMGRVLFHSVSMKPGKPMLAGVCGVVPVLGLPGHPRAVAVCYEVFIRPAINNLSGLRPRDEDIRSGTVEARLSRSISSTLGRQEVISVSLIAKDGGLWAEPVLGKSGLLSIMLRAHGTITVPAEKPGLKQGQAVEVKVF